MKYCFGAMKRLSFLRLILWSGCFIFILAHKNNVCRTFADYYKDFQHNPNCSYNPDFNLTVPQIIKRHGYPVQTYHVTTEDGYILTLFRIPHGRNTSNQTSKGPVFIQHGFGINSVCFVDRGAKGLAFILADQDYDVWLGNFRGTMYSSDHTTLRTSDRKYWDFSFQEHGAFDLPAQLNLVSKIRNKQIIYIGHSMGTTTGLIYGLTYPDEALKKIKLFVLLSPIAFMGHIKTIFKYLIPVWPLLKAILEIITTGHFTFHHPLLIQLLCLPYPDKMKTCDYLNMLLFGFDYPQEDPETLPVTLMQNEDEISIKTLDHFVQLIVSNKFHYYDYGTVGNIKKYKSASPPLYNLSRLVVPNLLVRGKNDLLSTKTDVDRLAYLLPQRARFNPPMYVVKYDKFSHQDFYSAKDVVPFLYDEIVHIINNL